MRHQTEAAALDARLHIDLARLNYPGRDWVEPRAGPDGARALDVAIVGAGMVGLSLAHGLIREGVRHIACLDAAEAGREGPWVTFARMETLRSPKHLTGPDLGLAGLTFRAWFEARRGATAWDELGKIDRRDWMDYLMWYRRMLDLPVRNRVRIARIRPQSSGLFRLEHDGGAVFARKVVLATGREGAGGRRWPAVVPRDLGADLLAHSADAIDFARLAGKHVGILGAGASAFDNAAAALEAGAAAVDQFCRSPHLAQVNKFKALSYPGPLNGHYRLGDAERWRFIHHALAAQVPPPRETMARLDRFSGFQLHFASSWTRVERRGDRVRVETTAGDYEFDFVILGTGFTADLAMRPELAALADKIALWRDRYAPPSDLADDELGRFPYLDAGFAFQEKRAGEAPFLADIHCFNHGCLPSHGAIAGDIPGLGTAVERLTRRLVEDLFAADRAAHWSRLVAADERELAGTKWAG
ncbi:MAG: NAD(P)/FAD-dependent oxidoreductase [Alphaproteobacteria bacterium]|nr:NAD(P)/FAD-dependent oxidoreductase [Alphaproteobacteria bacterium]